ncbi:TPA: AAA family ATPase [Candidatus Falkowbacteria bacterium]|nr:AAA family ATPase [Candidatus Falkowbacteria bacterium]
MIPLAERMRPESLEQFFGQEEVVGEKSFLRKAIEDDNIPSMILWGPPGTGKTTLARIIARTTNSDFQQMSATSSGVKDLRILIEKAKENLRLNIKTILFVDEIHRWSKSQQDSLLPHVESGTIVLIGATTENPSFEVNSAVISRSRVVVLKKLEEEALVKIVQRAISEEQLGKKIEIKKDEVLFLARMANGDARIALNTLELAAAQQKKITIDLIKQVLQKSNLLYDKNGEEHFNIISALHKSMRGGDANAAVYWLARMLEGGEDPIYIARRLVRFAAEDIGLANNTALLLANAVFDACHKLGMPECNVHLTQCVIYLAKSKKDVTTYMAYGRARKDVEEFGNLPVPLHLRNAPTKLMKDLNYGKDYKYTPLEDSTEQEYLPEKLKKRKYL